MRKESAEEEMRRAHGSQHNGMEGRSELVAHASRCGQSRHAGAMLTMRRMRSNGAGAARQNMPLLQLLAPMAPMLGAAPVRCALVSPAVLHVPGTFKCIDVESRRPSCFGGLARCASMRAGRCCSAPQSLVRARAISKRMHDTNHNGYYTLARILPPVSLGLDHLSRKQKRTS